MIAGLFHQGSGLGNQLHRYVATRVLALDKGVDFGMFYTEDGSGKPYGFKGDSFMKIDKGLNEVTETLTLWEERRIEQGGIDVRGYDPEINFVKDNTLIDGEFQDERYFKHRMDEVNEWLKVAPIHVDDKTCVIGFRGGEFAVFPKLFLTKEYWEEGMNIMKQNGVENFEVHTDDEKLAKEFFPNFKIVHDIEINWRTLRCAKHAIIANSSFYIFPRLLRHFDGEAITVAPRYWARRNTKVWALPQNYYKDFLYV